jgi:hypothetical protein
MGNKHIFKAWSSNSKHIWKQLPWGINSGKVLEVGPMVNFHYLQCISRKTFTYNHKPCFIQLTKMQKHWRCQKQMGQNVLHNNKIWNKRQLITLVFWSTILVKVLSICKFIGFGWTICLYLKVWKRFLVGLIQFSFS